MKTAIRLYSSSASDIGFRGFAQALSHNLGREVVLLPLTQLPAPDLAHQQRQRLLVERAELSQELDGVEAQLARSHRLDAGELSGLEFRRQALLNRRQAISRTLGGVGEASNG